jgi:hypothetical protein
MRGVIAAVLMSSLIVGSSLAAADGANFADSKFVSSNSASSNSVLAPGKAAGVARAQADNTTFYVIASGLLLVGVASFLISTDHSSTSPLVISSGNNLTSTGSSASSPPVSTR